MRARILLSTCALLVTTLLAGTAITLSALVAPSGRWMMPLGRLWSRAVLWFSGVRVTHVGLERAQTGTPTLFMANHQSMLDVPAIAPAMPDSLRFVAKRGLAFVPFFGWALVATGGCIFIDRGRRERAVKSLERAAERIRRGHSVLVFPEGTRTRDGRLLEFKKGPFHLAAAARVPIVPIVVDGTLRLMPHGQSGALPGHVTVRFGEPIAISDGEAPAAIASRVRQAMIALGAEPGDRVADRAGDGAPAQRDAGNSSGDGG